MTVVTGLTPSSELIVVKSGETLQRLCEEDLMSELTATAITIASNPRLRSNVSELQEALMLVTHVAHNNYNNGLREEFSQRFTDPFSRPLKNEWFVPESYLPKSWRAHLHLQAALIILLRDQSLKLQSMDYEEWQDSWNTFVIPQIQNVAQSFGIEFDLATYVLAKAS